MFYLYNMRTIKLIANNKEEYKIIEVLDKIVSDNCSYLIKEEKQNQDIIITGIRNKKDYQEYLKEYKYRTLTGKSCIELKKEIIDLAEKPKVKTLKK